MSMTLQSSIKDKILVAQEEASDESTGLKKVLDKMIERRTDKALYYRDQIWAPLKGNVRTLIMDKAHRSKYSIHPGADKMHYDLRDSREVVVGISREDFKNLTRDKLCPSNEMQKLETVLWNHAMVRDGHDAHTDRFHELDRLVPHLVTPENKGLRAIRNGSIKKNSEKRGNSGDPSRDRNVMDDNRVNLDWNAFATNTKNLVRSRRQGL
ncbi:hypothetical protein Tco_0179485 [Tanacetum coccineum]